MITSQDAITHGETGIRSDHTVVNSSYRHTGPVAVTSDQTTKIDKRKSGKLNTQIERERERGVLRSTYPPLFSYIQSPLSAMVGDGGREEEGFSFLFFVFLWKGVYAQVFFLGKKWTCTEKKETNWAEI